MRTQQPRSRSEGNESTEGGRENIPAQEQQSRAPTQEKKRSQPSIDDQNYESMKNKREVKEEEKGERRPPAAAGEEWRRAYAVAAGRGYI